MFGLAVITIFFWSKNHNFLTAGNFNNLVVQMAGVTIIAIGVVFVLLLGEIDLSIGFVSGVGGVIVAELQQPGKPWHVSGVVAIVLAVIGGAPIGAMQGSFVALIGVPSFVVTLAGLLAWQGVIINQLSTTGVIGIQDKTINNVANYVLPKNWGWALAVVFVVGFALAAVGGYVTRRRAGLPAGNPILIAIRVVFWAVLAIAVVAACNHSRGVPFAGLLV